MRILYYKAMDDNKENILLREIPIHSKVSAVEEYFGDSYPGWLSHPFDSCEELAMYYNLTLEKISWEEANALMIMEELIT